MTELIPSKADERTAVPKQVSVLIIGAGPVGLALAIDLSRRGVDCLVIDKGDGVIRHSKMGVVSVRTMEFCRRWGIAERVRNAGFPEDYALNQVFCTSLTGHLLGISHYPSMRDEPRPLVSPEQKQRCPQVWFDPILKHAVEEAPEATLRHHCELTGFEQHPTHVSARLRDTETGEACTVEAVYIVGCDGAGSDVRRLLGIEMQGEQVLNHSVGVYFRCPNLLELHDKGPAERYIMLGEEGNWGHLTVVDGREFWRLTVMGSSERLDMNQFSAETWVARCLGQKALNIQIESVLPWRRSKLVAERYLAGRVLLCGDAVHIMSPNGGYGMNTGVGDAADLGWKLSAVLAGWGGDAVLQSYEAERRPIGLRNTNAAAGNFARIMTSLDWSHVADDSAEGEAKRRTLGPVLEQAARGNIEVLGISLGYRYEDSPLCIPDGTPPTPDEQWDYVPTSRPGHRAPHAWIAPGKSMLDLFGEGFTFLRFGRDAADPTPFVEAARARNAPLTFVTIENPEIARLYERRLVLVRPDDHVAWRGDELPADCENVMARVIGAMPPGAAAKLSSDPVPAKRRHGHA